MPFPSRSGAFDDVPEIGLREQKISPNKMGMCTTGESDPPCIGQDKICGQMSVPFSPFAVRTCVRTYADMKTTRQNESFSRSQINWSGYIHSSSRCSVNRYIGFCVLKNN